MPTSTQPRDTADAVRKRLAQIRDHAQYLGHYSNDAAESASASAIKRLAREIEALLTQERAA